MSSAAAPFHFVTTFLVTIGAFACVWLTISRPQFAPRGWGRLVFGSGWVLLGVAEALHGAQFVTSDIGTRVLALRMVAYFLLLISLLMPVEPVEVTPRREPKPRRSWPRRPRRPVEPRPEPAPVWTPPEGRPGRRLWSVTFTTLSRSAGPAVLALGAGLFALRSRLEGSRRLALALVSLGASEVFLAHGGATTNSGVTPAWFGAHGLVLLGGLALGAWLWRAFRISIRARIVAALVLLLILVISLISAVVTNAFARGVRQDAFKSATAEAGFQTSRFNEVARSLEVLSRIVAQNTFFAGQVASRSPALPGVTRLYQTSSAQSADFLAFLTPDPSCAAQPCGGAILAISAVGPDGKPTLDESNLEELNLAGSAEVRSALQNMPAASVDDIGATRSKLVAIGAAPIESSAANPSLSSTTVIGAVVWGKVINTPLLETLLLPDKVPVTVVGSHGELLASTLAGADKLVNGQKFQITDRAIRQGASLQVEATINKSPYYVVAVPLRRSDAATVGAVIVSPVQTLAATQQGVDKTLFIGALVATLVTVGAASISVSRITRPIRDLRSAVERVRQGDLTARVPVTEADEVGILGEAFNEMTASIDGLAGDLRQSAFEEGRLRGELETILQSMTDGLIAVDRAGRIVTINREAERICAVSAEQVKDVGIEQVLEVHDSSGRPIDLPVYRLAGGSAAGFTPGPYQGAEGIPVTVTSAPITDKLGTVTGAVAVLRDLTTEMEVETMKTEFLANISHELRTPLTPIKGYVDLLRRRVVPRAKSISFLNVIAASTERMERIVDMLVDFSAMQAGRLVVRTSPFDLDRATSELVAKWQDSAPRHNFKRIGFEGLPLVAGDARLLPRAIDELIDNAVKFSPDGGPITIRGEIDAGRPGMVRVSITDHGIGITAEQMSRIFQDFVQVDASETRAFGGLGLGLAYVRRIIEAHDGELQVESSPGEGSTFSLLVPIWRGGEGDQRGGEGDQRGGEGGLRAGGGGGNPKPVVPPRREGHSIRRPPAEWPDGR